MNENTFFTTQSLGTLAGSVAATTVIANAIQAAFNVNPAWLALAVAEIVVVGTAMAGRRAPNAAPLVTTLFIAVINGFFVFASASGVTQTANTAVRGPAVEAEAAAAAPDRGFFAPWP